jgi:ribosome-binding factor A
MQQQHGGVRHHRERMGEAIREEIIALVEGELSDPRIGLVSVTEVQMAADGKTARVLFQVLGDDDEAELSLEGLNAARNYMRRELLERMHLRVAPELIFQLDRSEQQTTRIDELLTRIKKRNR